MIFKTMRNQTVIRTLIREMISEIDRFKKEKGRNFDILKDRGLDLEKMADEELAPGVPRYYFNLADDFKMRVHDGERITQVGKVSSQNKRKYVKTPGQTRVDFLTPMAIANPNAEYNTTPMGYYGYPLTKEFLNLFKKQKLPYMQGAKWLTIVEAVDTPGLMNLSDRKSASKYKTIRKKSIKESGYVEKKVDPWVEDWDDGLDDEGFSLKKGEVKKRSTPNIFTKKLLDSGITWAYDPGSSTIHTSEPTQVVFLSSKAFKVIERLDSKSVFESLTGGNERYSRTYQGEQAIDYDILDKLNSTSDPRVVAKLLKHPHAAVRKKAALHHLAPREAFSSEMEGIFSKLLDFASDSKKYEEFERTALDVRNLIYASTANRAFFYDKIVELADELTSAAKSNSQVISGFYFMLGAAAYKSKNESLAIRMIDDLSNNRIIVPIDEIGWNNINGAIALIAENHVDSENFISTYLSHLLDKKNTNLSLFQSTCEKILENTLSPIVKMKAIKAFAISKSELLPRYTKDTTSEKIHQELTFLNDKIGSSRGSKEYKQFVDTLEAIARSKNVDEDTRQHANNIITSLQQPKKQLASESVLKESR